MMSTRHLTPTLVLALLLTACGSDAPLEQVSIETSLGTVTGARHNNTLRFMGIPYARAPVGELRFMPPVPHGGWEQPLDATSPGNWCPQTGGLGEMVGEDNRVMDEDCLILNVWTPSAEGSDRPVLFWIHGGGHKEGSGHDYDGSRLAAQGDVVVVTINYRLGLLGFAGISSLGNAYAGAESNGFRDHILALEWVRDNIADYGGDAGNVTIFGESAGGVSVYALLGAPSAEGLYHRAIAHSGIPVTQHAEDKVPALAEALEVTPLALGETLRNLPVERLLELGEVGMTAGVVDGVVITRSTYDGLERRGDQGVPLITGFNRDEGTLFSTILPSAAFEQIGSEVASEMLDYRENVAYMAMLQKERPEDDTERFEQIWNDLFLRGAVSGAQRATRAGSGGWLYRFDMPATALFLGSRLGATHGAEIAFTFNTIGDDSLLNPYDGDDPDVQGLARQWSDTVIAFARNGNPNGAGLPEWRQYGEDNRETLVLDANSRIETNLLRARIAQLEAVGAQF